MEDDILMNCKTGVRLFSLEGKTKPTIGDTISIADVSFVTVVTSWAAIFLHHISIAPEERKITKKDIFL